MSTRCECYYDFDGDWRKWRAAGRKVLTTQTTVALGLTVIIAASQLLLLKGRLSKDLGRFGLGLGAELHGTFIGVTNLFYSHLARHLTRWENPRTQAAGTCESLPS